MASYSIAIIGGGVAGLTAARRLSLVSNVAVTLLEKEARLGGLFNSVTIDGLVYDIGLFLYTEDHNLFTVFPEVKKYYVPIQHNPIALRDKGKIDQYPISVRGYFSNFGPLNFIISVLELILAKFIFVPDRSTADYCQYYLGRRLYRRSGLKRYVEKTFKMSDQELDVKLGKTRISNLEQYSLKKLLKNAIRAKPLLAGNAPRYLARPQDGFRESFFEIERILRNNGVSINMNANILRIDKIGDKFDIKVNNRTLQFDRVISSAPLEVTQKLLHARSTFRARHVSLLTLFYLGNLSFTTSAIFNYTPTADWKRLTVHSHFYGKSSGRDYFSVEITLDSLDEDFIEAKRAEFEQFFLDHQLGDELIFKGKIVTPFAYPVYRKGDALLLKHEVDSLRREGIDLIGRQGISEYLSSHRTIELTQRYIDECFIPSLCLA